MNRFSLVCAATLSLGALSVAQPVLPPEVERGIAEPAPVIDAQAQAFIERMVARYEALQSYADVTQLRLENAASEPVTGGGWMGDMAFRATLQWERPGNIRFEGSNAKGQFLALGTDEIVRVISPEHEGYYVSRPRSRVVTLPDGVENGPPPDEMGEDEMGEIDLDDPLMGNGLPSGPGLGFILDPQFWKRGLDEVRVLSFDPDAKTGGEACRVLRMQFAFNDGGTALGRLFVAKSDGLIRRMEMRDNRMPADTFIVETHSDVRANPDLPATTWDFVAPTDAKPVEYFSQLNPRQLDPDLKIGALLPLFSGDALDGKPLELNPQSGKVTVVHFFTINSGVYDVQQLSKLARVAGPDKLQVIGVSGDGLRPRVEKFAQQFNVKFPIYFDERAMNNALARKFGVKGWATTFVFGRDGKLQSVDGRPGTVDFIESLQKLLPDLPDDAFILQDGEYIDEP